MQEEILYVKRLSENATIPVRGSVHAAGYDLFSAADMTVKAHGKALVPTDLSVAIPPNCYGRVAPRSGLALKKFIDVGAGVVDCDYRGPLGIVLFNFGDEDFEGIGELYVLFVVKKGDRVAQLVLERICMAPIVEVDSLDETSRGSGGFGSTGVKKVRTD